MVTLSSGFSSFPDKRVKPAGEDQGDSRQLDTGKLRGLLIMSTLPTLVALLVRKGPWFSTMEELLMEKKLSGR